MKQLKKPMLAAATIGIVGASTLGVSFAAHAQSDGSSGTLVDKIAQKFNLNRDEVQKVFDENRAEHKAERQQQLEEKLNQAVAQGQITSEQKDEILAKLKEMRSFMDSLKDKSSSERKSAIKAKRDELKQWAKDNNIPEKFIMPHGMHGPGGHRPGPQDEGPASSSGTN